jgi:hypothetical protein
MARCSMQLIEQMAENLTPMFDGYATYLPAVGQSYCEYVVCTNDRRKPSSVRQADLNFLNARSRLWTYRWCLASAGHLAYATKTNAISQRNPESSWVLGDSGGYQVATGALRETNGWAEFARSPDAIARLWRDSDDVKTRILNWLDVHCDYAMTLDMPLWVKLPKYSGRPFHHCSVELLTDLTVENLRFISDRRGLVGSCQFLNVIQGNDQDQEDYWYQRVRDFDFEGWAFGTKVNWGRVAPMLKRVLIMRDDGMLEGRKQRAHILGLSQLIWAVALTAIQRGIRQSAGSGFTVSYDSSTPFLWAGKFQTYPVPPRLTKDIRTWHFTSRPIPVGYAAATRNAAEPIPAGSPLSGLLTLGDINPDKSPYAARTISEFGSHAFGNHNTYVFIRAFIEANDVVFRRREAPQAIDDMVGVIEEAFVTESWSTFLAREQTTMSVALNGSRQQIERGEAAI